MFGRLLKLVKRNLTFYLDPLTGFVSIDELHAWTAQYKAGILAGPNRFSKVMAFAAALRWMKENVDCDNIDQLIA